MVDEKGCQSLQGMFIYTRRRTRESQERNEEAKEISAEIAKTVCEC